MRRLGRSGSREEDAAGARSSDAEQADAPHWCREIVTRVGDLEADLRALGDADLAARTVRLRTAATAGEPPDELMPEAFATVREAARRVLGQRHHDVQIMGGAALQAGLVTQMRTGEGKTLTATLPAYLNALSGRPVHLMTANEYLARRDMEWMRPVYEFLGLRTGLIDKASQSNFAPERVRAYQADVTYGEAQEFCYDFLRGNLARTPGERVQRGRACAIVDEADLIMIDGARLLPQILASAQRDKLPYTALTEIVAALKPGLHYTTTPGQAQVVLTDLGAEAAERQLSIDNLYDPANLRLADGLQTALMALVLYHRDRDYIVSASRVVPLDPTSGRPAPERTLGDGVTQAIEAKEGVPISPRSVKLAAMSMRAYLKGYERLMAMTGTATPDADSYRVIYGRDVLVVPTHRPVIRIDHQDVFYSNAEAKLAELVKETASRHESGQPVLIGADSIEQAAAISGLLGERDVSHQLLTAKNNEQEAAIIEGAARLGAVTVIAKMAGRGVDIVLGGPDASDADRQQVAELGGLCVLGAGRYVNRRLELHLRGRAGRQGDPGESKLFAAFDDEAALTVLGPSQAARTARMVKNTPAMSLSLMTREFDRGQARWAAAEAETARAAIEFDEVLDEQRDEICRRRGQIFDSADLSGWFIELATRVPAKEADPAAAYALRQSRLGRATMQKVVRYIGMATIDYHWRDHLQEMDALLAGIGLRAIGGRSPLAEYRRDAAELFAALLTAIDKVTVEQVFACTPAIPAWLKSNLKR